MAITSMNLVATYNVYKQWFPVIDVEFDSRGLFEVVNNW
jgi:hypothetical protein